MRTVSADFWAKAAVANNAAATPAVTASFMVILPGLLAVLLGSAYHILIEGARFRRRAAALAERQHAHDHNPGSDRKREHIAGTHKKMRLLCRLAVHPQTALFAEGGSEATRLEEARMPQPFVETQR